MTEQVGQFVDNQVPEGTINFALGQPSPRLLPIRTIGEAAASLVDADRMVLQYGSSRGFLDFRATLAGFLSEQHSVDVSPEHLCASGAISLSLSLLVDVFGRRGGVVVCEDPTYFLARGIFESAGVPVVGIPMDERGLMLETLRERIDGGLKVDTVYTIPSFQNPTGICTSAEHREALVALAEEKDFVVVSDEPYNLLGYDELRPDPLATLDAGRERVITVSSFTKILGPGLRLGWLQGAPPLLDRFVRHGALRSGGGLNPVMAYVVMEVIRRGGLASHLDVLRACLGERRDVLCDALASELPELEFQRPAGGYFVWARLPAGESSRALREAAKDFGVGFTPGPRCAIEADLDRCLRLSFAFYEPDEIREGVRRLARARARALES